MGILVESSFLVPAGLDQAWAILIDVPTVAPCIPGAEVTEVVDACTYKGVARVRIGPVQLVFSGEAMLHEVDSQARTCRLSARGGDTKGRGSVKSEMRFALTPEGESTWVNVWADITLAGTVAQYGRGVGMIREICNQLIQEFARNLAAQIAGGPDARCNEPTKPVSAVGVMASAVKAMVKR